MQILTHSDVKLLQTIHYNEKSLTLKAADLFLYPLSAALGYEDVTFRKADSKFVIVPKIQSVFLRILCGLAAVILIPLTLTGLIIKLCARNEQTEALQNLFAKKIVHSSSRTPTNSEHVRGASKGKEAPRHYAPGRLSFEPPRTDKKDRSSLEAPVAIQPAECNEDPNALRMKVDAFYKNAYKAMWTESAANPEIIRDKKAVALMYEDWQEAAAESPLSKMVDFEKFSDSIQKDGWFVGSRIFFAKHSVEEGMFFRAKLKEANELYHKKNKMTYDDDLSLKLKDFCKEMLNTSERSDSKSDSDSIRKKEEIFTDYVVKVAGFKEYLLACWRHDYKLDLTADDELIALMLNEVSQSKSILEQSMLHTFLDKNQNNQYATSL